MKETSQAMQVEMEPLKKTKLEIRNSGSQTEVSNVSFTNRAEDTEEGMSVLHCVYELQMDGAENVILSKKTEARNQALGCDVRMAIEGSLLLQLVSSNQERCQARHCRVPSQPSEPEAPPKSELAEGLGGVQLREYPPPPRFLYNSSRNPLNPSPLCSSQKLEQGHEGQKQELGEREDENRWIASRLIWFDDPRPPDRFFRCSNIQISFTASDSKDEVSQTALVRIGPSS
ncbi:hypothetical protein STEG23_036248 [Scotinomys teguina]